MATQGFLKACIKMLLPRAAQVMLRREVLARKVAHGRIDIESELRPLRFLVRPGDTVLDVGANAGVFAIPFARLVGERGFVFAFEPVRETFDVLTTAIRIARLNNVRASCIGISERPAAAEFTIPNVDGFRGYYRAHLSLAGDAGTRVSVALDNLDSLLLRNEIRPPGLIKCDVEGHEFPVLLGAEKLVNDHRPAWYMEVCRATGPRVFEWFQRHGYAGWVWEDESFVPVHEYINREVPNFFFLHPANPKLPLAT